MEMIPTVLHHHHHPQHYPRVSSVPLSIPMPRNPFYHCSSLSRPAAAAAAANANPNFRPFLLSLINPYPPPPPSSSTHRPFFKVCSTTTTTRSFCAAAATSTPTTTTTTTTTTISSPNSNSATTIPHHHVKQEEEPLMPPQNTTPPPLRIPLNTTPTISSPDSATTIPHHHVEQEEPSMPPQNITPPPLPLPLTTTATTTKTKTKKKQSGPLMTKESVAQLKQSWLSSLNNPNHPPNGYRVPNNDDWVIGIDPDVSGALALLKPSLHPHDSATVSAQVFDSPHLKVLIGKRIRRRLDTKAITELLQSFDAPNGTIAYLEQSLPYPGDGKQGWWSGGFNYGIWIGVLVALGFSVIPVPSLLWKNQFKLSGNGSIKDDSREAARTLFPSISSQLTRKKDHGRADALLIAAYGKGLKMSSYSSIVSEDLMPLSLECEKDITGMVFAQAACI